MYSRQKMENIKEGAYFDYFKFFSINAAETIRKLETTFKDEISEDVFFDAGHMFKRVKTLLSSYEVLLMEIKDSCEFVEIPEFGVCLMKIFFQLMSIIKFMGKSIILRSGLEKGVGDSSKRADQRHTIISSSPAEFYQNSVKSLNNPQAQERDNFRMKEMASHIFNDIRQEVANIEQEHKSDSLQNDRTLEKISKGRQKLQEIQSSQSEAVLSETVNMLYKKSEHINSFINIVQTNIALQSKENCVDTYLKIKEQFDEDCQPRFESAKERLNKLFKEHVVNYENKKKALMVSISCQARMEDEDGVQEKMKTSFHSNKKSTHISGEQVKKLKSQIKSLQEENKSLKSFIQEKCEDYENIITKLRSQKISMQCRSNADSKSVVDKYKSASSKKSQSYIQNIECTDNISEAPSHFSVQSENKEMFHTFESPHQPMKRSRVNLATNRGNRSKVKFHINDKQLSLCSKQVSWVITRDEGQLVATEEKSNEKNNQTEFEKIEERPSQHETSFRDNSAQITETLLKHSKFKAKKERNSLLIYNQLRQSKDPLVHTESGFNKSKKSFHPHCSIVTKKLMKRKESTQNKEETVEQQSSGQAVRSEKRAGKEGSGGKVSIFMRMEKENQKRFSGNKQRTESFPIISIEPIVMEANRKVKCTKFMEGIEMMELQCLISFERYDLLTLFFTQENASNYQLLNLTLLNKNNQFFTAFHNKNIAIKDISKSANGSIKNLSPKYKQKEQGVTMADIMTNIIFKYLKVLRKSKRDHYQRNYHIIKNFIRFPYSSVHRKKEKGWKEHETQNSAIQFLQLKKCIYRIFKLHASCKTTIPLPDSDQAVTPSFSDKKDDEDLLCDHWHLFVNRIGLHLLEGQ